MTRHFLICFTLLLSGALCGQNTPSPAPPATVSSDAARAYRAIQSNLLRAAAKMSEADYGFQPTQQERPFGLWVAHVADAQFSICSRLASAPRSIHAADRKTRAELLAALKESFAFCDAVYAETNEANALANVATPRGMVPRISVLYGNNAHDQECYGNMVVYLRLKGLVPPSTEDEQAAPAK